MINSLFEIDDLMQLMDEAIEPHLIESILATNPAQPESYCPTKSIEKKLIDTLQSLLETQPTWPLQTFLALACGFLYGDIWKKQSKQMIPEGNENPNGQGMYIESNIYERRDYYLLDKLPTEEDLLGGCKRVLMLDEKPRSFQKDEYKNAICLVEGNSGEKSQPKLIAYWVDNGAWTPHKIEPGNANFLEDTLKGQKEILSTNEQFSNIRSKCGYTPPKEYRRCHLFIKKNAGIFYISFRGKAIKIESDKQKTKELISQIGDIDRTKSLEETVSDKILLSKLSELISRACLEKTRTTIKQIYASSLEIIGNKQDIPHKKPHEWLELVEKNKALHIKAEQIFRKLIIFHYYKLEENEKPIRGTYLNIQEAANFLKNKIGEEVDENRILEICIENGKINAYLRKERYLPKKCKENRIRLCMEIKNAIDNGLVSESYKKSFDGLIRLKKFSTNAAELDYQTIKYMADGGTIQTYQVCSSIHWLLINPSLHDYILGQDNFITANGEHNITKNDLVFIQEELETIEDDNKSIEVILADTLEKCLKKDAQKVSVLLEEAKKLKAFDGIEFILRNGGELIKLEDELKKATSDEEHTLREVIEAYNSGNIDQAVSLLYIKLTNAINDKDSPLARLAYELIEMKKIRVSAQKHMQQVDKINKILPSLRIIEGKNSNQTKISLLSDENIKNLEIGDEAEEVEKDFNKTENKQNLELSEKRKIQFSAKDQSDQKNPQLKPVFIKENDFWSVTYKGVKQTYQNLDGFLYIHCLLSKPHKDISCGLLRSLKSIGLADNPIESVEIDENYGVLHSAAAESYQEISDADSQKCYKNKIVQLGKKLQEARKEAEETGDPDKWREVEELEKEEEEVLVEIKKNVNRKGKSRTFTDKSKKDAKAVHKAIATAYRHIQKKQSDVFEYLNSSIKTGSDCIYNP